MTATLSIRPTALVQSPFTHTHCKIFDGRPSLLFSVDRLPPRHSSPLQPLSPPSPHSSRARSVDVSTAPPLLPHSPSPLNGGARNEDQPCASSPVPCLLLLFPRFQKPARPYEHERCRLTWPSRTYLIGRLRDGNEASFYYECRRDGGGAHF